MEWAWSGLTGQGSGLTGQAKALACQAGWPTAALLSNTSRVKNNNMAAT